MRATKKGLWSKIVNHLITDEPTKAIIDSQSVKITYATISCGFDGKKTKGKKRFIVIDPQGRILACRVISASIHDTKGGFEVAQNAVTVYPSIEKFNADGGYRGSFVIQVSQFLKREVEISMKIKSPSFHVIKERWVVERTFTWLNNSRHLSKDYEILTCCAESMIKRSHLCSLLNRF